MSQVVVTAIALGSMAAVLAGCGGGSSKAGSRTGGRSPGADPRVKARPVDPPRSAIKLRFGAGGRAVPQGFLGLSMEFQGVRVYTGSDATSINPVLVSLIRNLSPGQAPVLRIGGDSTDDSYAPAPGVRPPPYVAYRLTPSWMATTAALAHDAGARMIMGLNLAAGQPSLAAAEARDYLRALGRQSVAAMEIGNEPNLYHAIALLRSLSGQPMKARPHGFGYPAFQREFAATAAALPREDPSLPLVGPALSAGPTAGKGSWVRTMSDFLRRDPSVRTLTVHRYPLRNCYVTRSSPQYPTIANLLSNYSTVGLAAGVAPWVQIAHAQGRRLRIDELNSVACRGRARVSDTFASALWATDALFSLVQAGVDGVNVHTLPHSAYELFQFSRARGAWRARVQPVYYGLQLFAAAAPAGSRLVGVDGARHTSRLSTWATVAPDRSTRLVLINKDPSRAETVEVPAPASDRGSVTVERMQAPSVAATKDVTLGGRSYGGETSTGRLRPPVAHAAGQARNGDYVVSVPGGSAALVTFAAG